LIKYELLDKVFAIGSNFGSDILKKVTEAEAELLGYLEENGDDPQVNDVLGVLKIFADESMYNDFEMGRETAAPILDRLLHVDEWDFYDIRVMVAVFAYAGTYEQVDKCAKDVLYRLEKHLYEKYYTTVKISIHMNILYRLLRARYFDLENMDDRAELKKIEDMFLTHFDSVMAICENDDFIVYRTVATMRKGILFEDSKLMQEGFRTLKKLKQHELCRMLEGEAKEYERYSGYNVSRRHFNVMVGHNIREQRKACKLSIDDVAKILDMSIAAVGLMERGDRGQTSYNLAKLAKAFGITADVFFEDVGVLGSSADRRKGAQLHKLEAIADSLSEGELEHIILIAESLAKLKK